jgi:predicted 3-demethylubiquinone-9 3-methyltransferase (glyoxalase superfamily)
VPGGFRSDVGLPPAPGGSPPPLDTPTGPEEAAAVQITQKITPCLWFDDQAEEAVAFYTAVFQDSRILAVSRYGEAGHAIHGRPAGSVMTIDFELGGQAFTALNGGPVFRFNEAVSFQVRCETQEEVDYYWEELSAGGDETAQECGWLKDRFGLSWQVVPSVLPEMIRDPESEASRRAMEAMLRMKKLDIAELQRAYAGTGRREPEASR